MKYKIRQSGKTQKVVEFHISKEIVAGELNKIYQEISKAASLPGFRKGKAPLEIVRKKYKNLSIMIPFVRSPEELSKVRRIIASEGLFDESSFKFWNFM